MGSKNNNRFNIDQKYAVNTKLMNTVKPLKRGHKTGSFADKIANKYALKESRKEIKANAAEKKAVTKTTEPRREEHIQS